MYGGHYCRRRAVAATSPLFQLTGRKGLRQLTPIADPPLTRRRLAAQIAQEVAAGGNAENLEDVRRLRQLSDLNDPLYNRFKGRVDLRPRPPSPPPQNLDEQFATIDGTDALSVPGDYCAEEAAERHVEEIVEPQAEEMASDALVDQVKQLQSEMFRARTTFSREPPIFTGFVSDDFSAFLRAFEIYALRMNMTSDQKLQCLPSFLTGPAAGVYAALPTTDKDPKQQATYDGLKRVLIEAFVTADTRRYFQKELTNRRQKPDERFCEYAVDIETKLDSAYPELKIGLPEVREQQLINTLRENALDDIKLHLLDKSPETFREAVSLGTRYEMTRPDRKVREEASNAMMMRIEQKLDRLQAEKDRTRTRQPAVVCASIEGRATPPGRASEQTDTEMLDMRLRNMGARVDRVAEEMASQVARLTSKIDQLVLSNQEGDRERRVTWADDTSRPGEARNNSNQRNNDRRGSRRAGRGWNDEQQNASDPRDARGRQVCSYCSRSGHSAYGCFRNPQSPVFKSEWPPRHSSQPPSVPAVTYAILPNVYPAAAPISHPEQEQAESQPHRARAPHSVHAIDASVDGTRQKGSNGTAPTGRCPSGDKRGSEQREFRAARQTALLTTGDVPLW